MARAGWQGSGDQLAIDPQMEIDHLTALLAERDVQLAELHDLLRKLSCCLTLTWFDADQRCKYLAPEGADGDEPLIADHEASMWTAITGDKGQSW